MRGKTKRKILAIELVGLIILSVFVASILAGRTENNLDNNVPIGRNENTVDSQEDIKPTGIPEDQQDSSSIYPIVDFTWSPGYPDAGEEITFICNCYSGYGLFISETWDFGDGSRGWGQIVSHTYNKKGDYLVVLSYILKDFSSGDLTFGNSVETLEIGASPFPRCTWSPKEPTTGENVNFDASESDDTNGQIVKYSWSYTEVSEPNKVIEMGNNKTFTYAWNKQGNYKVKLAVTDNDNNTNEITENIAVSILRIEKVTGGFRHVVLQITNRGNIAAENIQWKVYVNRNLLIIPLWKIFTKTGTISTLKPGESISVDIGRYRRAFGRITMTISVEASNAVKITEYLQGFMFNKYVHLRS